LSLFGQKTGKS